MLDFFKGTVTPKDMAIVGGMLGALVALGALYTFMIHAGQMEQLDVVSAKKATSASDLQIALDTKKNKEKLEAENEKIQGLVLDFESRLPEQREIHKLVREFEKLGDKVGVVPDLKSLKRVQASNKETIPYDITVYGTFHEIVSFINELERFERYVKVSKLTLGPEKEGICEAKFTLSTYRFIQSKPAEGVS